MLGTLCVRIVFILAMCGCAKNPFEFNLCFCCFHNTQRFFKYLCIGSKVPTTIKLAKEAIKNGQVCQVIWFGFNRCFILLHPSTISFSVL